VVVPSVVRGRHYLIAISTAGKSPAVSRYLRMRLQEDLADLDRMIEVQEEVRTALKETEPSQEKRSAVLWSILSDREVWDTLATDPAGARRLVKERYLHA
jgi:precorrin-2 dehydrogenase / sirohydrochlorin ferrochelatase